MLDDTEGLLTIVYLFEMNTGLASTILANQGLLQPLMLAVGTKGDPVLCANKVNKEGENVTLVPCFSNLQLPGAPIPFTWIIASRVTWIIASKDLQIIRS